MAGVKAVIILALRTDKPQAELYLYDGQNKLAELKWQADRQLADTLGRKVEEMLNMLSISYDGLDGLVCYAGPGSFTGLRIGFSVANALAYARGIPVVATKGKNWLRDGIKRLESGKDDKLALPFYDQPAKTTKPKK